MPLPVRTSELIAEILYFAIATLNHILDRNAASYLYIVAVLTNHYTAGSGNRNGEDELRGTPLF